MFNAIGIAVNAFVQLRRNAEHECPSESEAEQSGDESSGTRAHRFVHRDAIFCLSAELATPFCEADMLSHFVAVVVPTAEVIEHALAGQISVQLDSPTLLRYRVPHE
jgi:hypothetical protein